jgi:hypothetical protein
MDEDDLPPPSRTVVMSDMPFEGGLRPEVDDAANAPATPVATLRDTGPRIRRGGLSQSGVRGTPVDDEQLESADDAPQFFDRRSLESLSKMKAHSPASTSGAVSAVRGPTSNSAGASQSIGARALAPAPGGSRPVLAWAAMAFIALGLLIAVALALR